jgi:hypothetical protein
VLTQPTHAVGCAYMHVAAAVLQQGILLVTTGRGTLRRVEDFGTLQYDSSIILSFGSSPLTVAGFRGDGHFEPVCLFSPDRRSVDTVFERNHPLLCSIRDWAMQHTDPRTVEHERVSYAYRSAISVCRGEAFRGPQAPDGASVSGALPVPEATGTRPRRPRVVPARLRDEQSAVPLGGAGTLPVRPVAVRSLGPALARAALSPAATEAATGADGADPDARRASPDVLADAASADPLLSQPRWRRHHGRSRLTGHLCLEKRHCATCEGGCASAQGVIALRARSTSVRYLCGPRGVAPCCRPWPERCRSRLSTSARWSCC